MQEVRFEVVGPSDGFHLMLRRQGWHLTGYSPVYCDPKVISPKPVSPWSGASYVAPSFYQAIGDNTFRKLLRAVVNKPRTYKQLASICGDVEKLEATLSFLEWCRIVEREAETWTKGPACEAIDNIGPTLEWYVAEWFRQELQAPARHGVTLQEVPRGGDLDVVAFVNDIRVFVECKTGRPESISETDIRWFLQRAHDFSPEIAVLLIDTESPVTAPAQLAATVIAEMGWLENHPEATEPPDAIREEDRHVQPIAGYDELYSCAPNALIAGVPRGIDGALSSALRFYHSFARRQLILPIPSEWDFVERKIHGEPGNPVGVEGQLRM